MKTTRSAIMALRKAYPTLPGAYFNFLAKSNGAEGELGVAPGWVVIWSAEDALNATNEYHLPEFLPGYFTFGGNGGGELFVFPIERSTEECPVKMIPCIGMSIEELRDVSPSFEDFEAQIGLPFDESS